MSLTFYNSLNLPSLQDTKVTVQLTERSIIQPMGVIEDVLVQIDNFIFPADFYIIDMCRKETNLSTYVILGRPFLWTTKAKIDVDEGFITMVFGDETTKFAVYNIDTVLDTTQSINSLDKTEDREQPGPEAREATRKRLDKLKTEMDAAMDRINKKLSESKARNQEPRVRDDNVYLGPIHGDSLNNGSRQQSATHDPGKSHQW